MNNPEKPLQLERIENIKNILRENKSVKVGNLSTFFDVSENTIRRDLMELENEGFCIRSKGGATLAGKPDSAHSFSIRMDKNYELKREIAEKASSSAETRINCYPGFRDNRTGIRADNKNKKTHYSNYTFS